MTDSKEKWLEPSFLSEVFSGTALIVWAAYSELSDLDAYLTVFIGFAIYITFMISLLYRRHASDKLQLATLKAQLQAEQGKIFTEKVQAQSTSRFNELQVREDTMRKAIRILEDELKNDKLSQEKKEAYEEIVRRLKDFARAYSPF
jgi:biopolymer transport protein ExbD